MFRKPLNFLPRTGNLRLLQAGTLVAVLSCITVGSAVLTGGLGSDNGTAAIADTIASGSPAPKPSQVTGTAKPKAISENPSVGAALGRTSDTVRYYEQSSGKAFSVSLSTLRTDILSDKRLSGFAGSYWIPGSDSVVSMFQLPSKVEYRYFDYATQNASVVGSDFAAFVVAAHGQKVARLSREADDSYAVSISKPDGSDVHTLLTTRMREPELAWRTDDSLSVISRRNDRRGYDLSLIGPDGALNVLLSNLENLDITWSPDGNYLLYSYFSSDAGITLWLRDIRTGAQVALGLATSAGKCAWHHAGSVITCGVPAQTALTRDVPADATATIDDIYTYDLDHNTLRRIFGGTPGTLIGVTSPMVSSSDGYLVFTNMFDSRLYMLPLE